MTDEQKPIINITLPVKCETVRDVGRGVGIVAMAPFEALDMIFSNNIVIWILKAVLVVFGVIIYSIVYAALGFLVFGSLIAIATGYGTRAFGDAPFWINTTGAATGVVVGWILWLWSSGYIRVGCKK